jgi:Cdc6-like AAA superfamily ATPase
MLTDNPETLTEDQWNALQLSWQSSGLAIECTTSQAVGDIKTAIEQLCSSTSCDTDTQKKIIQVLSKIQTLGIVKVNQGG